MYAAGRIPGSFFRREGRPTDAAILACRLIDRPLRPSFAEGYRNETQVVVTVIGHDKANPYDVGAINGASAALMCSGIPFDGPLAAVRITYTVEGTWLPHPTFEETEAGTFELIVAGRGVGDDVAIMMVEGGGTEAAWAHYEAGAPKVTEEAIAEGLEAAKTWIRESLDLQAQLVEKVRAVREITPLQFEPQLDYTDDVLARVREVGAGPLAESGAIAVKAERELATSAAIAGVVEALAASSRAASARSRPPPGPCRRSSSAPASSTTACASTGVARPTCARSAPRSRSSRPPTARACSSGARPRS
jgi:polyribonucleotide nucleotidyltransferase